jgi:hypothetical protein
MNHSETAEHRELKRLALIWAQAHGYRVAAAEVSRNLGRGGTEYSGCHCKAGDGRERLLRKGDWEDRAAVGADPIEALPPHGGLPR